MPEVKDFIENLEGNAWLSHKAHNYVVFCEANIL